MPKQSSELPIAFYTSLVAKLLDRYSLIEHTPQSLLYQAMQDVIKALLRLIQTVLS